MIHGLKDNPVDEHFTVADSQGNLISGIDSSAFTAYVYNPTDAEVSSSVSGSFTELGDGNYKYTFTPDVVGIWYVNVTHAIYFPWGKNDDINIDSANLTDIYEVVIRTLGLTHHNLYIDEPVYGDEGSLISARVRIYSNSASVGGDQNIIETYRIEADELSCGKFSYWSQVKI